MIRSKVKSRQEVGAQNRLLDVGDDESKSKNPVVDTDVTVCKTKTCYV